MGKQKDIGVILSLKDEWFHHKLVFHIKLDCYDYFLQFLDDSKEFIERLFIQEASDCVNIQERSNLFRERLTRNKMDPQGKYQET